MRISQLYVQKHDVQTLPQSFHVKTASDNATKQKQTTGIKYRLLQYKTLVIHHYTSYTREVDVKPFSLHTLQVASNKSALSLDPQKGDRGIVIKNNNGDWAVLVGRWTGVKKGIPGVKGQDYKHSKI